MPGLLQDIKLWGQDIPWLSGLREKAAETFCRLGVPGAKTEDWKYTKPRDLTADDFVMQEAKSCQCTHHHEECSCHCQGKEAVLPFPAWELHFQNGQYCPQHQHLPRGVVVMSLADAAQTEEECRRHLGKVAEIENAPFAALNTAYLQDGLFIRIERDVVLDKPLAIINHTKTGAENLFFNLHHLVILENGAQAELLEYNHYTGIEKSRYFANIVSEILLGRNAKLKHCKLQDEAFKANHIALTTVEVKADAQYHNFCLQKGANLGRNEVRVRLLEKGAATNVDAAYKMSGWATLDTTTIVEHCAPETFSEQLVKGVVDGEAKGVFQGKIHIAPGADQTQGRQLHRALLLSDTAEIDCKPELEIFADDVKCSHGAASGELDEEQLFYMRSRGIDENEARQLLVEAFLDDVLLKVTSEEIRNWLKSKV